MVYELSAMPNGLRIATVQMHQRKSCAVAIWVRVGARYEKAKILGVSHFIEHMLFKGTKHRSTRQIKEDVEGVGGMLNAFTGEESTCYFAHLLKDHYPKALEVLADMVNHATFIPGELKKERTVILEEIKMYRDLPAHFVHEVMSEMLWPDQALGRPIAGTPETVSKMSRSDVLQYKKRHYHPKNILVSVAGTVSHQEIRRHAEKLFPSRTKDTASRYKEVSFAQRKPQTLFFEKNTEQTHFVIGLHGLSSYHKDRYALGILNVLLGGNMSSRLFEEVRERRGLAYEIKSGIDFFQDAGCLTVSAGVETDKVYQAISVILRELRKLVRKPVPAGELRRAKDYFMSQLYMGLEDTLDHLLWAGSRALYRNEMPDHEQLRHGIESVTAARIQSLARNIFRRQHLNLALIGPVNTKVQKRIRENFTI